MLAKDTLKYILKIIFLGLYDSLAILSSLSLFNQHSYKLLTVVLVGSILLNIALLSKKAYPLRYILPGSFFMLMLVVYPLVYTVFVALTNYSTGHILSKEQSIDQITDRYFLPENAKLYAFQAFKNTEENFIILLKAQGELLLGIDGEIESISSIDKRMMDLDSDGNFDTINGYTAIPQKEIFKNLSLLQKLEYKYGDQQIRMKNFKEFATYIQQYEYQKDSDTIYNLMSGVSYQPIEGSFTSPDGEELIPGFRTYLGFDNFKRLLTDKRVSGPFVRVFIWTFIWAFLSVLTTFALGLFMAILLNDNRLRLKTLYRILLVLPYSFPAFISVLVWRGLFDTEVGVINDVIKTLFGSGIPWLQDPLWCKVALVIVNLWLGFPYMMLIALGALQSISPTYYEAAAIDGASVWQRFRHITLPLVLVSLGPLLVSGFAFNFNNFNVIYLFNGGGPALPGVQTPAGATDILISYTYRLSFEGAQGAEFALASAVTIFIFIITATITWFNFRYLGGLEDVKENV